MVPKDIHVYAPGPPPLPPLPAQSRLDRPDSIQQLAGGQGSPEFDHLVQEVVLLGPAHRRRDVHPGFRRQPGTAQTG